jgi:hypothetical protein
METFLSQIAPTIASALLGPLGGVAVAGLGKIFGVENATLSDITKSFADGKLTPEQLTSIKELEMKLQAEEKERGFRYAELEFKNTADARDMQKQTKSYFPATLSTFITIGFFSILITMLVWEYKPTEPLLIMLGALGAAFGGVVNFWIGSSAGSQAKSAMLANSTPSK